MKTFAALALAACALIATPAPADELTPQKRADIEKLLAVTGSADLGKQMSTAMITQMMPALRAANPDIPQSAIDAMTQDSISIFNDNIPSLMAELVGIYDKYYTAEDLKAMLAFYETPAGKKSIQVLPALMADSMRAGQAWGISLVPQLQERMKARMKKGEFKG